MIGRSKKYLVWRSKKYLYIKVGRFVDRSSICRSKKYLICRWKNRLQNEEVLNLKIKVLFADWRSSSRSNNYVQAKVWSTCWRNISSANKNNFPDLRYADRTIITARKTIFLKSWNVMDSSKTPSKCHLSINFLVQKNTVFPIFEKFKTRTFH